MAVLRDEDREKVRQLLQNVVHPVKLVVFTQEFECEYCAITRELAEEVASLSDKVSAEVYDFLRDAKVVQQYGVDKIPAIVLLGERDYGIRFYGVPAGYEFMTLLEDILDVGRRDHGLPGDLVAQLARVDRPVHMQVMVSPTCPYCPRAVRTAHRFAMASGFIRADMVEVSEFPQIAVKYNVQGVPNTIINEKESIVGAQPERAVAQAVLRAIGK